MSEILLGVNNCFAVKRWTEPERWFSIISEDLKVDQVQISLDVVDLDIDEHHWSVVASDIRRYAEAFGVNIHSVFGGLISYTYNGLMHSNIAYRNRRLEWFATAIHRTGEIGAQAFGGPLGALTMQDYQNERRRAYMKEVLVEELTYLTEVARAAGLRSLLWEPTPVARELSHTTTEARDLCDRVNTGAAVPLRLCLDVGHQCAPGLTGEEADPHHHLSELLDLTEVVHLQQTDGAYDWHWPFTEERNKQGIITRETVMDIVRKSPLNQVYLMLEILHPFEAPEQKVLDEIRASVDYWR